MIKHKITIGCAMTLTVLAPSYYVVCVTTLFGIRIWSRVVLKYFTNDEMNRAKRLLEHLTKATK